MTHPCAELIARCFAARTHAHIAHLTTTNYAQHMALGEFYDAVAASADEFAECYMAVFGKLNAADFPSIRLSTGSPVQAITDLRTWIAANREECCEAYDDKDADKAESNDVDCVELASLIDNLMAVVDRALYKLKFLA